MIIRDMFKKEFYDKYGDVDVCNDVTDDMAPAFCGCQLTPAGEERFKDVLELEVELVEDEDYNYVIVKVDDPDDHVWRKYWGMTEELFYSAAGYCSDEHWDEWFKMAEDPAPSVTTNWFGPAFKVANDLIVCSSDMAGYRFYVELEDPSKLDRALELANTVLDHWGSPEPEDFDDEEEYDYFYNAGYVEVVKDALDEESITATYFVEME